MPPRPPSTVREDPAVSSLSPQSVAPTKSTPVISYDGQFSVSNVSKKIDMLDAYEFAEIFKEARTAPIFLKFPQAPSDIRIAVVRRVIIMSILSITSDMIFRTRPELSNTDWQDEIFRTALSHKHALSVSARTKNYNYYIGLNYLGREEPSSIGLREVRMRANLDGRKGKLKYGVSFSPSYSKTNYVNSDGQYCGDGVIASALMAPPVFPVYNSDGSYNWDMNGNMRFYTSDTQTNEVLNPSPLPLRSMMSGRN